MASGGLAIGEPALQPVELDEHSNGKASALHLNSVANKNVAAPPIGNKKGTAQTLTVVRQYSLYYRCPKMS